MKFDLKSMTRKDLEKLKNDVEKALERTAEQVRRAAMEAAEKAVKAFGLSLSDLTGHPVPAVEPEKPGRRPRAAAAAKPKPKTKIAPKYRNPENPEQTWTGRGRRPLWVVAAEASGKTLEDLKI